MVVNSHWLTDALTALPLALLIVVGLGLPLALLLLPRRDWGQRALVGALSITAGTAVQTGWLFVLGSLGQLTTLPILAGLAVLSLLAWLGLAVKQRHTTAQPHPTVPFTPIEKALLVGIVACVIGAWLATSYWPFSAYDTLWVYGYQARLYTLTHEIPTSIGYYPQYIQLQYAFYQIVLGAVNDHSARVVVLLMHVGSILAAYVLGSQLFSARRVGLLSAALWAFYPHVGLWAQMGDLEIPLSYLFTLAAALFLWAWFAPPPTGRRYALLAGLVFGVAMWTKPTAGAFVWGVVLLVVLEFGCVRGQLPRFWPRFQLAVLTGIGSIPFGAVWYVRNALLGHPIIDYPHPSWLTLARRSGDLFGWGLLALCLLVVWAWLTQRLTPVRRRVLLLAALLALAGTLPGMPWVNPTRYDPPTSYLLPLEWLLLGGGGLCLAWALWPLRHNLTVQRLTLAYTLALPYFITWFYGYSYHYRLSFAIVPLLALPTAWLLARWPLPTIRPVTARLVAGLLAVIGCLWGLIPLTTFGTEGGIDYLWNDQFPDDEARYRKTNPSLMIVTDALRAYEQRTGTPFRLIAPGEQQLRFFFPLGDMDNTSLPTTLDELRGATHYLYGSHASWRYRDESIATADNQLVSALGRTDLMTLTAFHDQATFRYELYELTLNAWDQPTPLNVQPKQAVIFGGFAQLIGWENTAVDFNGQTVFFNTLWQSLSATDTDATLLFELVSRQTGNVAYTWRRRIMPSEHGDYNTRRWQTGETVLDKAKLILPPADATGLTRGDTYQLRLRLVGTDDQPVALTLDGQPALAYEFSPTFTYGG